MARPEAAWRIPDPDEPPPERFHMGDRVSLWETISFEGVSYPVVSLSSIEGPLPGEYACVMVNDKGAFFVNDTQTSRFVVPR